MRASIDSFHRPRAQRYRLGASSPAGYRDSHDLDADEPSDQPVAVDPVAVRTGSTLIMDGLFLHREELVGCWTFSIFLVADERREAEWRRWLHHDLPTDAGERAREIDDRLQRARRERYIDGQALYELDARPRLRADAVVDNNDVEHPGLLRLHRR